VLLLTGEQLVARRLPLLSGAGPVLRHRLLLSACVSGREIYPKRAEALEAVRRNRVRGSRDDGFLVDKKDGHSLLRRVKCH
jgi:hypothetical protein